MSGFEIQADDSGEGLCEMHDSDAFFLTIKKQIRAIILFDYLIDRVAVIFS